MFNRLSNEHNFKKAVGDTFVLLGRRYWNDIQLREEMYEAFDQIIDYVESRADFNDVESIFSYSDEVASEMKTPSAKTIHSHFMNNLSGAFECEE